MTTLICILILIYLMKGKDVSALLDKVKNVDWQGKANDLYDKIKPYALKVGRAGARPLLLFYYVLKSPETSTVDRIMIYAAIFYTVSPLDLIPSSVYHLLGVLDEGAAILFVYKKVKDKITPEIESQVENTLNQWFGCDYEVFEY